jgi:hypothetical protein
MLAKLLIRRQEQLREMRKHALDQTADSEYNSESGEYESDRAGAYQAHAGRTWIGAGPLRTGAGQDDSNSDGAGARHTADRGAGSRTHDRAVIHCSSWAGAGRPATISVCLGFARTAIRQEATSEDDGLSPIGPARWARSRMDS